MFYTYHSVMARRQCRRCLHAPGGSKKGTQSAMCTRPTAGGCGASPDMPGAVTPPSGVP